MQFSYQTLYLLSRRIFCHYFIISSPYHAILDTFTQARNFVRGTVTYSRKTAKFTPSDTKLLNHYVEIAVYYNLTFYDQSTIIEK